MKSCELQLELDLVKVLVKEEKTDLQKHIEQTYENINEKCEKILENLKRRKVKK